MSTTLLEIRTQISDEISRADQLDGKIDLRVQQTVRWFERNQNFQYMHRFICFTLPSTQKALTIPLRPKRFDFMRYAGTDGVFVTVPRIAPEEVYDSTGTYPSGWWLDGEQYLRFDTAPSEDLEIECLYYQYSEAPTGDTATHWLFDNAPDFIVYQTMIAMSAVAKNPDWVKIYKPLRDEALHTLIAANQEIVEGGRDSRFIYKGGSY